MTERRLKGRRGGFPLDCGGFVIDIGKPRKRGKAFQERRVNSL